MWRKAAGLPPTGPSHIPYVIQAVIRTSPKNKWEFEMLFANKGDIEIYYKDTGGDLPVIIFSHGLLMDRKMFASQVAVLAGRHRCISWDTDHY